jgi:hypothetical protein
MNRETSETRPRKLNAFYLGEDFMLFVGRRKRRTNNSRTSGRKNDRTSDEFCRTDAERRFPGAHPDGVYMKLLVSAIDEILWTVGEFEVRRDRKERSIRFAADDIRELKGLLAHAGIGAFAVNDGLQVG